MFTQKEIIALLMQAGFEPSKKDPNTFVDADRPDFTPHVDVFMAFPKRVLTHWLTEVKV